MLINHVDMERPAFCILEKSLLDYIFIKIFPKYVIKILQTQFKQDEKYYVHQNVSMLLRVVTENESELIHKFIKKNCICSSLQDKFSYRGFGNTTIMRWSNIVRYYINYYRNWGRISSLWIRCWIHKRHHIPRPNGRAIGCLLWIFVRKLTTLSLYRTVYLCILIVALMLSCIMLWWIPIWSSLLRWALVMPQAVSAQSWNCHG